jgi:hypothetical protein
MSNLSIATKLFNLSREFGAQQALIAKYAKTEAEFLPAAILKNDQEAQEVSEDMLGWMSTETIIAMCRAALRNDHAEVLRIVLAETNAAIEREAERRAIKHVESLTPEDFLPD